MAVDTTSSSTVGRGREYTNHGIVHDMLHLLDLLHGVPLHRVGVCGYKHQSEMAGWGSSAALMFGTLIMWCCWRRLELQTTPTRCIHCLKGEEESSMTALSRATTRLSTCHCSLHVGREEDDMATSDGADARNPSHGGGQVAGGLWWP